MDGCVECLVKAQPNKLASLGKTLLIVAAVLLGVATLLYSNMLFLFFALICCIGAYTCSAFINIEYEYLYLDKQITIDKIYNQSRRKKVATFDLAKMEVFAPVKSYHLSNYGVKSEDPKDFSIGFEDQPDLRYIMYMEGSESVLLSPSEEMVKIMKNAMPRKVFED